ncbi:MAG: type II toxin-antitoxin system RelE/ParE family toxin [Lentisphaerae bacterium]|nr:type II toxin-antitoxin system RelE/ParE family toxin [Lentisphaerota bacterium]
MAGYEILLRRSVLKKDLQRIPQTDAQRIMAAIHALADNPRPPGVQKLSGQERYRFRQGDYRIIYSVQDQDHTIWIVKVGHRRDVYR